MFSKAAWDVDRELTFMSECWCGVLFELEMGSEGLRVW
jgi:hypothetical protein